MPRNYDRDDENGQPVQRSRYQRSRSPVDFGDSDEEDTKYRRRSIQQKYRRDHSDSEGEEDLPIQGQRRGKDRDVDVRNPQRQQERTSSFVPRTLQPSENRIRSSSNSTSAWGDSRDNWAEKENSRVDERSKPKPWAMATETTDRPQPIKKFSRQSYQDEDNDDEDGTTQVEEYVQPIRNKAKPPPKSQYQPHRYREEREDEIIQPNPSSQLPQQTSHYANDHDDDDQDSTSNHSLPLSNPSLTTTDDETPVVKNSHQLRLKQDPSPPPPHLSKTNGATSGAKYGLPFTVPFLHLCPLKGENTTLVQCLIIRNREDLSNKLYPTYSLYLEDRNKLLMVAQKKAFNSTSNYHLWDMSRGSVNRSSKMNKKSGNYLGKLRAADANRSEYTIVTASTSDRTEIGAIVFDRNGIVSQMKEGCQPRKMFVKLPDVSSQSTPVEHHVMTSTVGKKQISMVDMLKVSDPDTIYASKDPVFERGNYRLNFGGRVTMASVKNFQLASPAEPDNVICQFGKIAEDKFHLDYKTPLNAFQAFCLALCHFDT
jgi:tubby and related proteins